MHNQTNFPLTIISACRRKNVAHAVNAVSLFQLIQTQVVDQRRYRGFNLLADQAEYTPRNVQTQEERVKTVFAVEIALENPEGLLRAGMPADAVLAP
jgi:hypothetical protein